MGCPKNPKKILIFSWHGPHEYEDFKITRFGDKSWAKYRIERKCPKCGVNFGEVIRDEIHLQKYGYDVQKLQKIKNHTHNIKEFKMLEV